MAIALDHYYTSLESWLEMVSRTFDSSLTASGDWHCRLLELMGSPSEGRPAVLDPETARALKDLLAFRHFMRHAYAVDLEWKRMKDVAAQLPAVHAGVKENLLAFRQFLERCLEEAERGL